MAFGRRTEVARADVVYEANLGQFRAEQSEVQRVYERTTGSMSTDALRLAAAQEKVNRAVARSGPESLAAKQATIGLRREMDALANRADHAEREINDTNRSLGRLSRGALAGSGAFRGLGRSIAFASSGFLGGAGLVYGIRQAIGAASDLNEQTTKTEAVFGGAADEVLRFADNALGQAKDQALETASSIGALLAPIGVVEKDSARISIRLTKLGTDLSSFYNTDVASALTAIKSGLVGESEPLRRYGVQLSAARVEAVALADSNKENAKQLTNEEKALARVKIIMHDTTLAQGDYAKTIGGAANQEREFSKNLRDTEAAIGQALQPAYRGLLKDVNAYLGDAENQKRVQDQVNDAVRTGGEVLKGLAEGLKIVKAVAEPVIDALGGVQNAAELALIVGIVAKARKAALSFGLIGAASNVTRTKVIADAVAMEAALDTATRPRTVPITVVQTGAPAAPVPGAPTGGGKGGRFPKIPFVFGFNAPTIIGAAVISAAGSSGARTQAYDPKRYPRVAALLKRMEDGQPLTDYERSVLGEFNGKAISELTPGQLARLNANLGPQATGAAGGDRDRPNQGRALPNKVPPSATPPPAGGDRGDGLNRLQRLQLATSEASLTQDLQDDLKARVAEENYYRQIAADKKLHGDKLFQARQDLINAEQATQGVRDQIAADQAAADKVADDRRRKAAEKRKARLDESRERQEKLDERVATAARKNAERINKAFSDAKTGTQLIQAGRKARASASGNDPNTVTRDELGGFLRQFLTDFTSLQRERSNFGGGFAQTTVLEQLTRETNGHLSRIGRNAARRPVDDAVMA